MCSIPYLLFSKDDSNHFPQSTIKDHQNFCKLFLKVQTSYERLNERKKEENKNIKHLSSSSPESQIQSKIWNWFENLSFKHKKKICTIKNKWLVKIIIQLYFIYSLDRKSSFEPTSESYINILFQKNYQNIGGLIYKHLIPICNERKNYLGYYDEYYIKSYFNLLESDSYRITKDVKKEEIDYEEKLLNNIILLSVEDESLDTISLNEEFLKKDLKTFKRILDYFSNKNYFKDWLTPFNFNNCYNFSYPEWMHNNNNQKMNLCKFISGVFEQQILVFYQYFLYTNNIYDFSYNNSIEEINKDNKNLETFLKDHFTHNSSIDNSKQKKENVIAKNVIENIVNKIKAEKKFDNFKKMCDQLHNDYYKSNFYIGNKICTDLSDNVFNELNEEMEKGKSKGKEMQLLLNKINYIKFEDVKNYREYIYIYLRKYFIDLRKEKIINELLNENKSGKKKKKKRKNKLEPKNIISNEDILNNNNINKKDKDKDRENDNIHNIPIDNNNNSYENIEVINNGNNSSSSNDENEKVYRKKTKENEDTFVTVKNYDIEDNNNNNNNYLRNSNNTKEIKNKNKEFFLFPISNKKQKNKNKNNYLSENNIEGKNNNEIENINNKKVIKENEEKEKEKEKENKKKEELKEDLREEVKEEKEMKKEVEEEKEKEGKKEKEKEKKMEETENNNNTKKEEEEKEKKELKKEKEEKEEKELTKEEEKENITKKEEEEKIIEKDKKHNKNNFIKNKNIFKKEDKKNKNKTNNKKETKNEIIKETKKEKKSVELTQTTAISIQMLNDSNNTKDKNYSSNKIISIEKQNPLEINKFSPLQETTTFFSYEPKNNKENEKEENNEKPVNMTINIINNQYIYQQYNPFINMQFLYYYHTPSELFFDMLTKEINNYCNFTYKNIEYLNTIRIKYLKKIENLIKTGLEKKYKIKFGHYGSYFTNLSIEGSDLDILVFYKPNNPNFDFLKDIIDLLNNHEKEFECIHPILSASVPVIKLQFNISNEIDHKIIQFLPYYGYKDISHIKIDLTFTFDENEFKRPDQIVTYINKKNEEFPNIKPLLLVLKRYFRIMKMNKSFTGGLSSHSLFLLVLAFLKNNPLLNSSQFSLGKSLYFSLEKYSFFDYNNYGIDVEGPQLYYLLKENLNFVFNDYENRREEINIIDPFTKINVAKSSFQVDEIKNTFNKALFFFKFEAWKYDSNNYQTFNSTNNLTIIDNNKENDFIIIKKFFSIK